MLEVEVLVKLLWSRHRELPDGHPLHLRVHRVQVHHAHAHVRPEAHEAAQLGRALQDDVVGDPEKAVLLVAHEPAHVQVPHAVARAGQGPLASGMQHPGVHDEALAGGQRQRTEARFPAAQALEVGVERHEVLAALVNVGPRYHVGAPVLEAEGAERPDDEHGEGVGGVRQRDVALVLVHVLEAPAPVHDGAVGGAAVVAGPEGLPDNLLDDGPPLARRLLEGDDVA
mmetsp:Transcript_108704/g.307448  ORF Transcript_108704/g.307448 Transcript_108704/m.307448 type:complete len:227 (+) Transcript_108704:179-859(+)